MDRNQHPPSTQGTNPSHSRTRGSPERTFRNESIPSASPGIVDHPELGQDRQPYDVAEASTTTALGAWHLDNSMPSGHRPYPHLYPGAVTSNVEREAEQDFSAPVGGGGSVPAGVGAQVQHRRRVKQPLGCPGCDKFFERMSALKQHLLTHTGERPHACPACSRRFTVNSNRKRHLRTCKALKHVQEGAILASPTEALATAEFDYRSTSAFGGSDWVTYRDRSGSMSSDGEASSPWSPHSTTLPLSGGSSQPLRSVPTISTHRVANSLSGTLSLPNTFQSSPTATESSSPIGHILPSLHSLNFAPHSPHSHSPVRPSHSVGPRLQPMRTTSLPSLIRDPTGRHEFRPGFEPPPSIPSLSESSGESNSRASWSPAFPPPRYASQMSPHGLSTVSPVPTAQGQSNASPSGFYPTHLPPRRQSIPTGSSESSFSEFPGLQSTIPGAAERWPPYRAPESHHPTSRPHYPTRPSSWGARSDLYGRGLLLAPSSFSNEERPPSFAGPTSDARRSNPRQYGEYKEGDN